MLKVQTFITILMKTLKNILFNFLLKYTLWTTIELSYIFINISYFNQTVRARKYFKLSILIISHRGHLMPRKVNCFLFQKSDSNGRASSGTFDLILPKPPSSRPGSRYQLLQNTFSHTLLLPPYFLTNANFKLSLIKKNNNLNFFAKIFKVLLDLPTFFSNFFFFHLTNVH